MKDYVKYKDKRNNKIYIAGGSDFCAACDRAQQQTPAKYREFVASLIQTPVDSDAGKKFFSVCNVLLTD